MRGGENPTCGFPKGLCPRLRGVRVKRTNKTPHLGASRDRFTPFRALYVGKADMTSLLAHFMWASRLSATANLRSPYSLLYPLWRASRGGGRSNICEANLRRASHSRASAARRSASALCKPFKKGLIENFYNTSLVSELRH